MNVYEIITERILDELEKGTPGTVATRVSMGNAALIIQAVNSHAALVDALKELLEAVENETSDNLIVEHIGHEAVLRATQALALATKETP